MTEANPAAATDGELAARVARGDRAAAQAWVTRHLPAVRAFLMRLTFRHADADDLTQETLLRMLRYADRYDPTRPVTTWLFTIAYRLWVNHAQREGRRRAAPLTHEPTAAAATPAGDAEHREHVRRLVDGALGRLTPAQRDAVVLFHRQQLPIEQVAVVMGVPVNTVKSHLHRARSKLRDLLQPHEEVLTP